MSEYRADRIVAQDIATNEFNSQQDFIVKLTTTGKVQANWPSVIAVTSTAARNLDMPLFSAAGVPAKLWWIFNFSTATITVRTSTGGTIIALTITRRGAMVASIGGAWKLVLKSAT